MKVRPSASLNKYTKVVEKLRAHSDQIEFVGISLDMKELLVN